MPPHSACALFTTKSPSILRSNQKDHLKATTTASTDKKKYIVRNHTPKKYGKAEENALLHNVEESSAISTQPHLRQTLALMASTRLRPSKLLQAD